MKNLTNILIILGLLFVSHGLHAEKENPFERAGIIHDIRPDENIIIISDTEFGIITNVLVNVKNKKKIGINNLSINLPIGYNAQLTGNKLIVNEVWILDKEPVDDD